MLRGRSALARVCLCLVCLLGPAAELQSRDLLKQVQTLIGIAPQLNDSGCWLYTPTAQDYEKCPSSSLTCFSEEVQVLIDEWANAGVIKKGRFRLKRGLRLLAVKLKKTESECSRCELFPEEEAKTFLSKLKETIQKMNSRSLSP
ncbi:hypothetical protein VZT92_020294 [Zoarces viviparus]|uniref:Interleukin n=1 Tax=Zoarces viviparus TaxID=48416 RepID=A0AAW1ECV5_ZOAVI